MGIFFDNLGNGQWLINYLWKYVNRGSQVHVEYVNRGRRFKSPSGRLIRRKFFIKRKNSMIYVPLTWHCTPDSPETYWAR